MDQAKPEDQGFFGTSKNAVLIQIWTALITYLLLVWPKFKSKTGWGLLELTRLAQPCSWNDWTCERCFARDHQIIDSHCYSISVPDKSSDIYYNW